MTEYFAPAPESNDDDDTESAPSKTEHAPVRQVGEILLGHDNKDIENAKPEKHETFWKREDDKKDIAERLPLFIDLQPELEDDDDDEEEEEAPSAESVIADVEDAAEAPLEELGEEEKHTVIEAYDADRSEELAAEREDTEPGSAEDAAIAANELFIEKVDEKLEDSEMPLETAIEEAAAETEQAIDEQAAETPDIETEPATDEADDEETLAEVEPDIDTEAAPEAAAETDDEDEPDPAAAASSTASASSSSGGSGTPPPPPPVGSGGTGTPPPPPSPPPPFTGGPAPFGPSPTPGGGFNTLPTTPAITPEDLEAAKRHGETTGLVVGGLLGYLIGRRRGRIKTEKRLLPIQEKLEGQVRDLHETVSRKEQDIRRLAAEKFNAMEADKRQTVIEKIRPQPKPPKQLPFDRRAEVIGSQVSPELSGVPLNQVAAAERFPLGVTAEDRDEHPELYRSATTGQRIEIFKTPESPPPKQHIESIERLSQQEILEMSEKVIIAGARLRDIYEAKQITEPGLRHILTEFLSGGDLKKALDQELLVKQMTYERDPRMRDNLSAGYASPPTTSGGAAAAGVTPDQLSIADGRQILRAADQPARPMPQQSDTPDESLRHAKRTERAIITGWLVFVSVLVIVILWLLARRG